jgi:hypothetical protein
VTAKSAESMFALDCQADLCSNDEVRASGLFKARDDAAINQPIERVMIPELIGFSGWHMPVDSADVRIGIWSTEIALVQLIQR